MKHCARRGEQSEHHRVIAAGHGRGTEEGVGPVRIERLKAWFGFVHLGRVCTEIMIGKLSKLEVPDYGQPFESLLPVHRTQNRSD